MSLPEPETQILNLVLDELVSHLTLKCQTEIDVHDLTYADVVKKGLLQENKTQKNIAIGVTGGDHEQPDLMDGIATLETLPNIAMKIPPREVGGGEIWARRGVARLDCYFIRERLTESQAHEAAYNVLGRVMSEIPKAPVRGLVDSFGERCTLAFCYGNTFFESGGPPKAYIFRGKVLWLIFTERP